MVIRKHPNLYADVSALHYRPFQLYHSLMLVQEYGVWGKLLFGTDFPITNVDESVQGLRRLNQMLEGTSLPLSSRLRRSRTYASFSIGAPRMQTRLTKDGCKERQRRFIKYLNHHGFDLAVITDWRDVYYFSGVIKEMIHPRAFIIDGGGAGTLMVESEYPDAVADTQLIYAFQTMATLNFELNSELVALLRAQLPKAKRIAVQNESLLATTAQVIADRSGGELIPIDDDLLRMQTIKDSDEIALLRRANELNDIGYAAVREAIKEGATEAEVLAAGKAAVTRAAGCDCFYSGDFRCGQAGGFATDQRCRKGQLYIIDAWVNYQGYWSDNCRTFPVTGIDDVQRRAWELTEQTVLMAEQMVRPNLSSRKVFEAMKEMQDKVKSGALCHHGGHGTGLRLHTYPRINPHFDDTFEAGNVITIEPGVYGEELRGGIRLESNYWVSQEGVERLNQFPISIPDA